MIAHSLLHSILLHFGLLEHCGSLVTSSLNVGTLDGSLVTYKLIKRVQLRVLRLQVLTKKVREL